MKTLKISLFSAALLALSACSVTPEQCDPSVESSVWNKMACTTSGTYDQRVQEKESSLQQAKEKQAALNQNYTKTKQKADEAKKALKQKKAEVAQLNKSVNSYAAQLKAKAKGKDNVLAEIKRVEQELKAVNGSGATDEQKQAEIKALQRKLQALQQASGM